MGLAAPKRRTKLAQDPNNTRWTGNTDSFGHRLMTANGWQPGDFLGAKDAKHAEHYTAANASHIRVTIKDDTLGLGAKIGSGVGHGECTGLDAFKNLLGRLNGKDEDELEKEQKSREDLKRAIYSERKWGNIRFVRGGLLIGDKIQPLIEAEAERLRSLAGGPSTETKKTDSSSTSAPAGEAEAEKPKKSKKRKLEDQDSAPEVVAVKVKKSKRKRKAEGSPDEAVVGADTVRDDRVSRKKSKKDRGGETDADKTEAERQKRKVEKKEKKARKEEKLKSAGSEISGKDHKKSKRKPEPTDTTKSSGPDPSSRMAAPSSGYSTPIAQGRHAVRARNIAQKRLASMDVASLNQIFMIKS